MASNARPPHPLIAAGFTLAPIHPGAADSPLRLCVLARAQPDPAAGSFLLLRELPGSRVYLGAIADAAATVQEWVEIWVQTVELRDLTFSNHDERLSNSTFDERWRSECQADLANQSDLNIATGLESRNPPPILIKHRAKSEAGAFAATEAASWQLCTDDKLLDSLGLPPYTTSPFRYLYEPAATGAKTFLPASPDAPTNAHTQGIERLATDSGTTAVFNPHSGSIRVRRFDPLAAEELLSILEGQPWQESAPGLIDVYRQGIYGELQAWSGAPKGMPFLFNSSRTPAERLNEIFFLKLSVLLGMFKEVRSLIKARQLPLLNLSPTSFRVRLPQTGDAFPALWASRVVLAKPGQAHPLKIKTTEQKYFVRLGKVEPSPFLPEGLGAHSFGIGSVRRRNVTSEADGIVLEGTLVAEDFLGLDSHDLLWFKLPVAEERVEFYAHVYADEAVGPREARFRTVPMKLPDAIVATLKHTTAFAKAPYEIWPLLSSPCDLHSLGVIALRVLLADGNTNLPATADDVLGIARRLGKDEAKAGAFLARVKTLIEQDTKLFDLLSPHKLAGQKLAPVEARAQIHLPIWVETMAWLLRLFPGAGSQSFCQNFGDVSPLALETVFDAPIQDLEALALRLRSVLVPTTIANEEIAEAVLELLAKE